MHVARRGRPMRFLLIHSRRERPRACTPFTITFLLVAQPQAILLVLHFTRAARAALGAYVATARVATESNNGTIYRAATTNIVPVLRPVVSNGTTRFAHILEVGTAEVLVLLNIKPEV